MTGARRSDPAGTQTSELADERTSFGLTLLFVVSGADRVSLAWFLIGGDEGDARETFCRGTCTWPALGRPLSVLESFVRDLDTVKLEVLPFMSGDGVYCEPAGE